jgi:hypothetical protein
MKTEKGNFMPVIFVHGVNTRKGPAYDSGVKVKTALLKRCLQGARINGKTFGQISSVTFPFWGDLATTFAWDMASLPRSEMEALSVAADGDLRALLALVRDAIPGGVTEEPLLALAKRDFPQAVEVLATLALEQASAGLEARVAEFVIAAQAFAAANPNPSWLANTQSDLQLLGNLNLAIAAQGGLQPQGLDDVVNALSTAATKLKNAAMGMVNTAVNKAGDFASTKLLAWTREPLNANLGRFFGDVFIYFDTRGDKNAPGPIPQRILTTLDEVSAGAPPNEPFVIVGHSLGAVITFDLLGHFRPGLNVDLFVSAGSQVAHFEEIKLYKMSDKAVKPPGKARTPGNIQRWINVYDEVDIFSYAAKSVFDRVHVDARYDTRTYVIKAHSAYFDQARFYDRLRARIDQLP